MIVSFFFVKYIPLISRPLLFFFQTIVLPAITSIAFAMPYGLGWLCYTSGDCYFGNAILFKFQSLELL